MIRVNIRENACGQASAQRIKGKTIPKADKKRIELSSPGKSTWRHRLTPKSNPEFLEKESESVVPESRATTESPNHWKARDSQ